MFAWCSVQLEQRPLDGARARKEAGEAGGTEFAGARGASLRIWNSTRQGRSGSAIFIITRWWHGGARIGEDKTRDKELTHCSGPDRRGQGLSQLCIILYHISILDNISILLLMDTEINFELLLFSVLPWSASL